MHKPWKRSSLSAPYKPHGVGTPKSFFGSNSKKTKSLMIFDPQKGVSFLLYPRPHHPPPHLPQKPPKVGFKWGGAWEHPDQKLIGGCVYWTK